MTDNNGCNYCDTDLSDYGFEDLLNHLANHISSLKCCGNCRFFKPYGGEQDSVVYSTCGKDGTDTAGDDICPHWKLREEK